MNHRIKVSLVVFAYLLVFALIGCTVAERAPSLSTPLITIPPTPTLMPHPTTDLLNPPQPVVTVTESESVAPPPTIAPTELPATNVPVEPTIVPISAETEAPTTQQPIPPTEPAPASPPIGGGQAPTTLQFEPLQLNGPRQLPASLFYIGENGQLWQLAADAITTRQISAETTPITDFHVHESGDHLLYVTNNDLYYVDMLTQQRTLPG